MSREEFLRGLEEALAGEVPASVVRDNLNYYSSYLSQELAKGRTMEEIIEEIGEPRIVARTIIDSTAAMTAAGTAMTAAPAGAAPMAPTKRIPENGGSSPIISTISI